MGTRLNHLGEDEPGLLRMYMDLTGCSEADARNVLMYVCSEKEFESESEALANDLCWSGRSSPDRNLEGNKNGIAKLDHLAHELVPPVTIQAVHAL